MGKVGALAVKLFHRVGHRGDLHQLVTFNQRVCGGPLSEDGEGREEKEDAKSENKNSLHNCADYISRDAD
jgi:hypothetical protein